MKNNSFKLSFCITCKNRLHQVKKTLKKNLNDNFDNKELIEFVLVDFGSNDGLLEYIQNNFMEYIHSGYLKYYYTEALTSWHASKAKNISHLLASNDLLVNLDCDNYTGKQGGLFVIHTMQKYNLHRTILHQSSNNFGDGSFGRICLSKLSFIYLGGYDESFEPMGYEDNDLLLRASILGMDHIHIGNKKYNKAIRNTREDSIRNINSSLNWNEMRTINYNKSLENITTGKLIANNGVFNISEDIYEL